MPTKEYRCRHCGHCFKRVVFQGDKETPLKCRNCGKAEVDAAKEAPGLFRGISSFSVLAKDTN